MNKLLMLVVAVFFLNYSCAGNEQGGEVIAKDIKSEDMAKVIDNKDIIILDVRTPGETKAGIIKNAIIIEYGSADFKEKLNKLDKSKPVYVYCAVGGRSKKAQNIMKEAGFKETYNLLGGFNDWSKKGLPTN